jgi:XTP/dITP diphosphohydrolase
MRPVIILATRNPGKVREIRDILSGLPVDIGSPDLFPGIPSVPEIEETGATLEENALIKAGTVFRITGLPAIADDTGLEVDALGGAPGVISARYAGENVSYDDNNRKLLDALSGVGEGRRTARFRCVAAYAGPGNEHVVEGRCEGSIGTVARGTRGFGYDPLFIPDGYDRSFAELPTGVKNLISHRSAAFRKMGEYLRGIYQI